MVGTKAMDIATAKPFEIGLSKSPDFKWSVFRSPLKSNNRTVWGIQILD